MNEWDEKIYLDSIARDLCPGGFEDQEAFMIGARWQREALLSDETVERAALAIARAENADYWAEEIDRWEQSEEWERKAYPDEYPGMAYEDRGQFREAARAALTAAIGDDDE